MTTIEANWPTSITEISRHLGFFKKGMDEKARKSAVAKISYHVKKLEKMEKIRTKKIGQTVIVWPHEIEKLKVVHELIR